MGFAEKSSDLTLSKEEMIRQEAIQTLEELGKKQNQASLLLLKLQQHLLTWSVITVTSAFILVYFGSSLFCLSPQLSHFVRDKSYSNSVSDSSNSTSSTFPAPEQNDSDFCKDKYSDDSALIGIIAASIAVIGVIQATNKGMLVRKLAYDLRQSKKNYNNLFEHLYH
jgi:hypothetical protein